MIADVEDAERILTVTRALARADLDALGISAHDVQMLTILARNIGREYGQMLLTPEEVLDQDTIGSAANVYGEVCRVRPAWLEEHLRRLDGKDLAEAGVQDVPAYITARVAEYLATSPPLGAITPEEVAGLLVNDWELDSVDLATVTAEVAAVFADLGRPLPAGVAADAVEAARCAAIASQRTGRGGGIVGTAQVVLAEHRNAARYATDPALLRRDVEWAWAAGWSRNPVNWPAPANFDAQIALAVETSGATQNPGPTPG